MKVNLKRRIGKLEQIQPEPEKDQARVDQLLQNLAKVYGESQPIELIRWPEFDF